MSVFHPFDTSVGFVVVSVIVIFGAVFRAQRWDQTFYDNKCTNLFHVVVVGPLQDNT